MTCINCQSRIEKKLCKRAGIKKVTISYENSTGIITYDKDIISLKNIIAAIESIGYTAQEEATFQKANNRKAIALLIIIAALYMLLEQFGLLNLLSPGQLASAEMGYGMLFVIGIVTSVHCIAMCGGINLTQSLPGNDAPESGRLSVSGSAVLYNLGRVISYTIVGFIVGGLGSVVTFSDTMQGVLKLIAGIFMIIMGINMLGMFPWLRKLNPRMPRFLTKFLHLDKMKGKSPLIVGLLNGLMPCGPLQAMQIYALSTGNPFTGALSMFLFSLGTVPLMLGLGVLASFMGRRFTKKVMTVGAVLVVVLGLSMLTQGYTLSGFVLPFSSVSQAADSSDGVVKDGVQVVESTLSPGQYPNITVTAGTPVKWIIDAPAGSINGCNNRMFIREYGIEYTFSEGENIIEFTPDQTGSFQYSCWMGMIRATIDVISEDGEKTVENNNQNQNENNISGVRNLATDGATAGCCAGSTSPDFANGNIPTDNIQIAEIKDGVLQATVKVDSYGYSPAVIVVQKGQEFIINFDPAELNGCNTIVAFPEYNGQIDLSQSTATPKLTAENDFGFQCSMGMLNGYVTVVDDINNVDLEAVKQKVEAYQPASGGGAGCCG